MRHRGSQKVNLFRQHFAFLRFQIEIVSLKYVENRFQRLEILGQSSGKQEHVFKVHEHISYINDRMRRFIHLSFVGCRSRLQAEGHNGELINSSVHDSRF